MTTTSLLNIQEVAKSSRDMAVQVIRWYYLRLKTDRLLDVVFYDHPVETEQDFINISLDNGNLFMLMMSNMHDLPVGHMHVNGFEGLSCRGHFCMVRDIHGRERTLATARGALHTFFAMRRADSPDTPIATSMIGLTPTTNRLACRFVQQLGFKGLATIPDACYIHRRNQYVPGMLSIITPEQLVG